MSKILSLLMGATVLSVLVTGSATAQSNDITIVLSNQPDMMDPCMVTRSKVIKQNVVETVTEMVDGNLKPRLATEWSQVDDHTWRFKLREGVKFQDGSPFNAAALKYSIDRILDKKLDCEARTKYFSASTLTVTPISDYEVEIKSDIPQPILPKLMSTVVAMSTATPMGVYTREPIGTGPYRLAEWVPDQRIVLERTDEYWGEKPAVAKATYIWRTDSAVRAAMVKLGEADIAPSIAIQDATDPETDTSYLNSETTRFRIDLEVPPLDDIRVRKALNLALDREAIRGTLLSKEVLLSTQVVPPGTTGFNSDIVPYKYDLEEAKRLVAEARAAGVPVDKEIVINSRYNLYPNVEEVLQAESAMWKAAGLNVKIKLGEAEEWYRLFLQPFPEGRGPSLIEDIHDNDKGDAVFSVYNKYHSKGPQSALHLPKTDDLIERARLATGDERQNLYAELFRTLHDDVISDVYLFHLVGFTRVNKRVSFVPTIATNSELQLSQVGFK